jgi:hypothetical protein
MHARHPTLFPMAALIVACATSRHAPAPEAVPAPPASATATESPIEAPGPAASPMAAPVSFEASIQPLLARRCTPCHVPGGRMYGRLPFDQPEVVRANREGILRRLKDEDEKQLLERWLDEGAGPQATRSRPASLAR